MCEGVEGVYWRFEADINCHNVDHLTTVLIFSTLPPPWLQECNVLYAKTRELKCVSFTRTPDYGRFLVLMKLIIIFEQFHLKIRDLQTVFDLSPSTIRMSKFILLKPKRENPSIFFACIYTILFWFLKTFFFIILINSKIHLCAHWIWFWVSLK